MSRNNEKEVPVRSGNKRCRSMLYRMVFSGLFLVCLYMGLRHRPAPQLFRHFDLFLHFGIFLSLAFICLFAFPRRIGLLLLPLLVGVGLGIEVIQDFFLPGRNGSWNDFFANTLGVAAGGVLGALFLKRQA